MDKITGTVISSLEPPEKNPEFLREKVLPRAQGIPVFSVIVLSGNLRLYR